MLLKKNYFFKLIKLLLKNKSILIRFKIFRLDTAVFKIIDFLHAFKTKKLFLKHTQLTN